MTVPYSVQVLSLGALIAATISLDKLLDINNSDFSAVSTGIIDTLSPDVRQVTTASVALAIASGVVIPMEIVMIVLRFFKIKLGIFGRIIVIVVYILYYNPLLRNSYICSHISIPFACRLHACMQAFV